MALLIMRSPRNTKTGLSSFAVRLSWISPSLSTCSKAAMHRGVEVVIGHRAVIRPLIAGATVPAPMM